MNNRITYATAQFSIKDNRFDPTNRIRGWVPVGRLRSTVASGATGLFFTTPTGAGASVSGLWGNNGMVLIKSAGGTTELIRYTTWASASGLTASGITRGAAGTTPQAHTAGDRVQQTGWEVPLGVQSVSIGTAFNTEDIFTLGQLDAYENTEGLPEIEVTVERVFDGTKPLFLMVTDPDFTSLKGRTANFRVDAAVAVYPDTQDSATGTPDSVCCVSGCFISAWSCSFVTDGPFKESITLVGNDKTWGGEEGIPSGYFPTSDAFDAGIVGSGVQRSENFDRAGSTLPAEIHAGDHIQSIEVAVDITREDIFELGRKTPFFRAVAFPVTVTTTFTMITDKGDLVNALGTGVDNLVNRTIILNTTEELTVNLGTKNKLSNITFDGFDAGGGNGTVTLEYTNSNSLTVTHLAFTDVYGTMTDLHTVNN